MNPNTEPQSTRTAKKEVVDMGPALATAIEELTQQSETLGRLIERFSRLDPVYILVQKTLAPKSISTDHSIDIFSYASFPTESVPNQPKMILVTLPYGRLMDNLFNYSDMSHAQHDCDQMNRQSTELALVPKTPSMVFFEQKCEVDRLLQKLTTL